MDFLQGHAWQFGAMLGLLALSGFFSGSETALFSLTKIDLHALRRRRNPVARAITALAAEPAEFLHTVLFCNMLVNISFFSLAAGLTSDFAAAGHGHQATLLLSLGALLTVIVLGEVTPKSLAVLVPQGWLRLSAVPMAALHRLLWPVRRGLGRATRSLTRLARVQEPSPEDALEELKLVLEASAEEGELTRAESAIVSEIIDLSVMKVKEFMTPRVDLVMAEARIGAAEFLALARRTGHTKIPVFRRVRDEIIGVADARDVYLAGAAGPLRPHIQPAVYVTVYQRASDTLAFLQSRRTDLAVAVDEYGGTAGIVTLSDVMTEVFGEAAGQAGRGLPPIRTLGPHEYLLAGTLSLRDWRSFLRVPQELPAVDTLGGLVAFLLGRVPRPGDTVRLGRFAMTVEEVRHRRVHAVRLRVLTPEEAAAADRAEAGGDVAETGGGR
jgi:putative hemolysin